MLSADGASVDNTCDYETLNGILYYNFHFFYVLPFVFDPICLDHFIEFEGINIPEGLAVTWEYAFDGVEIIFTIPHLDLEASGCTKITEDD